MVWLVVILSILSFKTQQDATMKVDVEVLRRAYESLQDKEDADDLEPDALDPESHLYVIDAFEMPLWHWSPERGTFEKLGLSSLSEAVLEQ